MFTDDCVAFLKKQAVSLGLPLKVYSIVPGKPIVVLTWEGSEPNLSSVLLNSHMDVVPVFPVSTGHMWTVAVLVKIEGFITWIFPSELKELLLVLCVLQFFMCRNLKFTNNKIFLIVYRIWLYCLLKWSHTYCSLNIGFVGNDIML